MDANKLMPIEHQFNKLYSERCQRFAESLCATAADAMLIVDAAGTIAFANQSCLGLFAYNQAELMGARLSSLLPEVDLKCLPLSLASKTTGRAKTQQAISLEIGITAFSEAGTHYYWLILRPCLSNASAPIKLSKRQREILRYVVAGHSSRSIAEVLHISPKTVETHRAQMMKKLQVRKLADLVRVALEQELV